MKKTALLFTVLASTILLMATQCDDDLVEPTCEQHLESLSELGNQIESLVSSSECNDASECRFIAFGSKPCGGPWEYLIYSTSIDTLQLQNLVETYNEIEEDYNLQCDVVSDCAFVSPPEELACVNGQCVAVE